MDSIELLRMLADYCTTYIRTYVVPSGFSQDRWQVYLLCFNSEFATNSCAYIFLFLQIKWQAVFFFSFALDDACETEIKGEHGWMYRQKEEKEKKWGKKNGGIPNEIYFLFFRRPGIVNDGNSRQGRNISFASFFLRVCECHHSSSSPERVEQNCEIEF